MNIKEYCIFRTGPYPIFILKEPKRAARFFSLNPLHLKRLKGSIRVIGLILCIPVAPTCKPNQTKVHGVAKQEKANISCQVDANPPEVQFRWTFNNSAESIDVAAGHIARAGTSSIVSYTPMTELDYGTLLCWATNRIGHQQVPCVYHIIPAGEVSLCGNPIIEIPVSREIRHSGNATRGPVIS